MMDPLNFETDLQSLRRLYGLLHSNANNESIPQAFLLDENTQFLLKRLLDSATEELLARQTKILAQVQLGLPPSKNTVSKAVIKLPSKAGLTEEVVDSIERIETQLSAFSFCSRTRDDKTRTCKSRTVQDYSSSVMPFQRLSVDKTLMGRRQSYQASVSGLRRSHMPASMQMSQTTRTSSKVAPRLMRSVNNNVAARDDRTMDLESQGSSSPDDQVVSVRSRTPLPPRPVRPERPRESDRTSLKMGSMKPTLLDQETETWDEESGSNTRSRTSSQVSSTDQESEEESRETGSTTGSSWQTHGETGSEDSSYPSSESEDSSQESDSPPHKTRDNRSSTDHAKQKKKSKGRLTRFKEKLGKVFHHHHYHHHHHENKEQGHKPSVWKHLVKKHLQKDKEKLVERRMKSESKGLVTKHNKNKGGQFHALVEGLMRHRRRHSKMKKQSHVRKNNWWKKTRRRQGGIKFPNRGRVKLGRANYLCNNKDQEHDEN